MKTANSKNLKSLVYDHSKIEAKWQKIWEKKKVNYSNENLDKKKFYGLIEFPYPSGAGLHVGHIRSNTAMDIIARKRRREGYEVLFPIGWDAFGLPTENYAIKTGIQPAIVTKKNTDIFRRQLKILGFSFDWSREIDTTDPKYYKWTQWIFLQMYKKGLAYKKKMSINWCPKDLIGLANEEVVNGCCERCGTPVEKREKEQWMLAITKYADRLDKDLDDVDYLEKIKIQQRNWIGKSEGALIKFKIQSLKQEIEVFTTRPDTLFGVTYLVLAPENPLVTEFVNRESLITNRSEVIDYILRTKKQSEIDRTDATKEKTGVELKGIKAINPANNEEIPVWIADYVLVDYGTGAVMAVPAHDDRDWEFAKKFNLKFKNVISPLFISKFESDAWRPNEPETIRPTTVCIIKHWSENKYLFLNKKNLSDMGKNVIVAVAGGIDTGESIENCGIREITEETGYKNIKFIRSLGDPFHYRFYSKNSNQNRLAILYPGYFELIDGEQIEISEHEKSLHETIWLSEDEIESKYFPGRAFNKVFWNQYKGVSKSFTDSGIVINSGKFDSKNSESVKKEITEFIGGKMVTTYKLRDWVFSRQRYWGEPIPIVHCEKCGVVPVPEKDLPVKLPKVKNYQPSQTGESPLSAIHKWVNTKCPECKGKAKRETDTMPQWAGSSWYYLRYTDPKNSKEFAAKDKLKYWTPVDWYNGGMEHTTLHLLYSRFWHKFLFDLGLVPTKEPYQKRTSHGLILADGGAKMSKSKGNIVSPDEIVKIVGADSLRLYEMFMGPFDQSIVWNSDNIAGVRRFIERVWKLREKVTDSNINTDNVECQKIIHKTIKKVSDDIESMSFNTAVSSLMIALNELDKFDSINKSIYEIYIQLLAPFAPHVSEELNIYFIN